MSCTVFIFSMPQNSTIKLFAVMSYDQILIIFHTLNVLFTKNVHEENKNIGSETLFWSYL